MKIHYNCTSQYLFLLICLPPFVIDFAQSYNDEKYENSKFVIFRRVELTRI